MSVLHGIDHSLRVHSSNFLIESVSTYFPIYSKLFVSPLHALYSTLLAEMTSSLFGFIDLIHRETESKPGVHPRADDHESSISSLFSSTLHHHFAPTSSSNSANISVSGVCPTGTNFTDRGEYRNCLLESYDSSRGFMFKDSRLQTTLVLLNATLVSEQVFILNIKLLYL